MIKIGIGSTNPAKVKAVESAIKRLWPTAVYIPVAAPSSVSDMPMSDEETLRGATNRARAARVMADADFGIGLEGGVQESPSGMLLLGWVAVMGENGRLGIGGTARIPLPDQIARRIRAGEELGPVIDDILHADKTNQKGGTVGALTNGLVVRGDAFETAVYFALAPFISPELYGEN